ncbi:hypothetical protein [Pinibacter soli]|uniref:hypothetical protein n=1 Tax=Pinibacter soli TaxID=3044211 RepID=UPI002499BB2B|nr:hypothetical protein [Pinibacter soli]
MTCFRATKLVREKWGLFASIVFVFGLLSFMGSSNNDKSNKEPNSNQIKTWKFTPEDSLDKKATFSTIVKLEQTLVSDYQLHVTYGQDQQKHLNTPISASAWRTGLVSGTNWKPEFINVNQTDDNTKFEYFVDGTVEWKLLGMTIYSQPKLYKGFVSAK